MINIINDFRDLIKDYHEIDLNKQDREIIKEALLRHKECIENGTVAVNVSGDDDLISIDCDDCSVCIISSDRIKAIHKEREKIKV